MRANRVHEKAVPEGRYARERLAVRAARVACALALSFGAALASFPAASLAEEAPRASAAPSPDAVSSPTFDLADVRSLQFTESGLLDDARFPPEYADAGAPPEPGDFWIAYEETGTDAAYLQSVGPLLEALRIAFPERRILLTTIPSTDFVRVAKARKIPFAIATAGTMAAFMMEGGAVPIASREDATQRGLPAGGLLVANASRADLSDLKSLKGKRIAIQSSVSFGPWQRLQGRLLDEGFPKDGFFSAVIWRAHDVPEVVNAVLHGHADVGLLTTCAYEGLLRRGLIDPAALKPVAALSGEPGACRSSTLRYPDWAIGYTPYASNDTLRRLAAAAFSLPAQEGYRWGIRVDLSGVQSLMEKLHYGPYQYLDEMSPGRLLERYKEAILTVLAVILLLALHGLRANHLVRVRTKALTEALAERDRMEQEAKVSREQLTAIERVGMLSQMSSMFAHELKQPLASITNYIGGLRLWNKAREAPEGDKALAGEALDAMAEEAKRVTAIVERVRGYAKSKNEPLAPVDWCGPVRRAASIVERHDTKRVPILMAPGEFLAPDPADDRPAMVMGDALELELLALNLMRNAGHAAFGKRDGFVSVSLTRENGRIALRVADNGPRLNDQQFARLTGWGESVKQEGLGIGLSICRGIADRHGGALRFYRLPIEGICAEVEIEELPPEEAEAASEAAAGRADKAAKTEQSEALGRPGEAAPDASRKENRQ